MTIKGFGLLAAVVVIASCAGKKDPGPLPPQAPPNGVGGGPADIEKARQEAEAKAEKRDIKLEEFSLTLTATDKSVAQIEAINVDVISTDAENGAVLVANGPVKYRDSRITGGAVRSHTFKKGGVFELKVPGITPADAIVLWADLAAPEVGNDTRMLKIPLKLDKSDLVKGPIAKPIRVKLTANGWVRES